MIDKLGKNRTALLKDIKVDNLDLSNVDLDEFKNESNDPYVRESEVPKDVSDLTDNQDKLGDKNVKSDWDASSGDAEILNKPDIPTDIDDLTDATGILSGKEDKSNKATNLNNPNNTDYPTTKAVTDALDGVGKQDLDSVLEEGNESERKAKLGGLEVSDHRGSYNTSTHFSQSIYMDKTSSTHRLLIEVDIEGKEGESISMVIRGGGYTEEGVFCVFSSRINTAATGGTSHYTYYKGWALDNSIAGIQSFVMDDKYFLLIDTNGSQNARYGFWFFDTMNFKIASFEFVDDFPRPEWGFVRDIKMRYFADKDWANDRFLRYDTDSQNLTPTEQENARTNLGIEKPKTIIKDSNFLIDNSLSGALVIHEDNIITINKSGLDGMNDGYQVWLRNDSNSDATLAIVNTGDFTFRINDENDKTSSENVTIPKGTIYRIDKKDNNKILIYIFPISNSDGGLELGWSAGQAAEGNQVVRLSTNQTISGVKTFESIPVLPNSNPTSNNQSARKKYVDDQVGSRELLSNKVQDIMSNISPDLYPSTQAVALFAQYILNEFDTEISNYFSTKYRTSDFTLTEDYRLNTIIAGNIEIEIDPNEEVHTSFKCDIVSDHSSGTAISLKSKSGWTYRVNDMDDISSANFRIPAGGKISIYKKTDNQKFIITGNADMQS